jgi:hypothetical protein
MITSIGVKNTLKRVKTLKKFRKHLSRTSKRRKSCWIQIKHPVCQRYLKLTSTQILSQKMKKSKTTSNRRVTLKVFINFRQLIFQTTDDLYTGF